MRQGLIDGVTEIVQQELEECIKQHGLFNSAHEGFAIMLEEVDETTEDAAIFNKTFLEFWKAIKENKPKEELIEIASKLKKYVELMACEAIQVAAVCLKFIDSSKEWDR